MGAADDPGPPIGSGVTVSRAGGRSPRGWISRADGALAARTPDPGPRNPKSCAISFPGPAAFGLRPRLSYFAPLALSGRAWKGALTVFQRRPRRRATGMAQHAVPLRRAAPAARVIFGAGLERRSSDRPWERRRPRRRRNHKRRRGRRRSRQGAGRIGKSRKKMGANGKTASSEQRTANSGRPAFFESRNPEPGRSGRWSVSDKIR